MIGAVKALKFELALFDGDIPEIFRALNQITQPLDGRSSIRAGCGLALFTKALRIPFASRNLLANARVKALRTNDPIAASYVETVDAIIHLSWNNFSSALVSLDRADAFNLQHEDRFQYEMTETVRGLAMVFAGDGHLANLSFKSVEESARLRGNLLQTGWGLYGQAMAKSILSEPEDVLKLVSVALAEMSVNADNQSTLICNSIQAATLIQLGGVSEGLHLAAQELEHASNVTNFGSLYGYTSLMVACVRAATADKATSQEKRLALQLTRRALRLLQQYGIIFPLGRQRANIARESVLQLQNPSRNKFSYLNSQGFQLSVGEFAFARSLGVV
jgi:hypothetical protein